MKKYSLLIISMMLIGIVATSCNQQVFNGNRTGNETQFIMDYSILNKTEVHEMNLKEGTIIDVIIVNKAGRLDILVTDNIGQEVYRGNNVATSEFSLEVQKTDTYKFSISGKKAKGNVSFKVVDF